MQEFLTFKELTQKVRYCRMHVNRLVKAGHFPPPVWFGPNRKLWRAKDVDLWLATRPTARPEKGAALEPGWQERR
jgi:predicted DNA-binding transcriptional regulator AlpA